MAQEKGIGWRSRGGVDMLTKPTRRCFAGGEEGELQGENRGVESSIRSGSRALAKPARPGLAPAATSTVRRGWCPRRCTEQRRKAVAMPQDDASGVYGCRESGGKQEEGWHDPGRTTAARQGVCNACAWCRSAGIEEGERKEMSCLAWKLGKMAALGRRLLLQPLPLLAQQALRRAVPPPIPHCCFLHSCFPPAAAASPSPPAPASPSLSGSAGSLLPTSAGAVVVAAPGNGSLGLEQRGGTSGWLLSSSALLLHAAPWAHWATTPADDTVFMLIGANVSVFMLWRLLAYPRFITGPYMISLDMFFAGRLHTLLTSAFSHVDPMFMMKHFTISLDNFMSRRLHTLLTSAFSHMDVQHLFNNMVGLYFFGSSIARMFGPAFLLQLYVTGALTGSAFYLAEMIFLAPRKQGFGGWKTPCLGASAAVNATILLEIFLHPTKLLYLHFFIPVPAALVGVGLIGADLWRVKKGQSRVSGSSHLGGALVAAVAFAEIKGWI